MREVVRQSNDHDGRQDRPIEGQMIGGYHDLLCAQAKLPGDVFDRVDRCAIEIGLTRLAQAAVADLDPEALE
jgi:hypothetical protein